MRVCMYEGERISNIFCGEKRLESKTNRICKGKMMAITVLLYNRPQKRRRRRQRRWRWWRRPIRKTKTNCHRKWMSPWSLLTLPSSMPQPQQQQLNSNTHYMYIHIHIYCGDGVNVTRNAESISSYRLKMYTKTMVYCSTHANFLDVYCFCFDYSF